MTVSWRSKSQKFPNKSLTLHWWTENFVFGLNSKQFSTDMTQSKRRMQRHNEDTCSWCWHPGIPDRAGVRMSGSVSIEDVSAGTLSLLCKGTITSRSPCRHLPAQILHSSLEIWIGDYHRIEWEQSLLSINTGRHIIWNKRKEEHIFSKLWSNNSFSRIVDGFLRHIIP